MKYQISRFIKSIFGISRGFERRVSLSCLVKNQLLEQDYRVLSYKVLTAAGRPHFKSRCFLTARSRFVISAYRLSRICFKEFCTAGLINGFKKSQW
jgi:ribosomal protein S14